MVPARFVFKSDHIEEGSMPIPAADAIFSATVQAMTNSAEHASKNGEEVTRSISVSGLPGGGLHVIVQDDGAGFDLDRVSSERLGVRVSIRERVVAAGGDVEIDSAPGEGTRVSVSWQHPPVAERRDFDDDSELAAMSQNSESALAEVREGGA